MAPANIDSHSETSSMPRVPELDKPTAPTPTRPTFKNAATSTSDLNAPKVQSTHYRAKRRRISGESSSSLLISSDAPVNPRPAKLKKTQSYIELTDIEESQDSTSSKTPSMRAVSLAPTEVDDPDAEYLAEALGTHGVKAHDFAYQSPHRPSAPPIRLPEIFDQQDAIVEYEYRLHQVPRIYPIPGKVTRRLLDMRWITPQEVKARCSAEDLAELRNAGGWPGVVPGITQAELQQEVDNAQEGYKPYLRVVPYPYEPIREIKPIALPMCWAERVMLLTRFMGKYMRLDQTRKREDFKTARQEYERREGARLLAETQMKREVLGPNSDWEKYKENVRKEMAEYERLRGEWEKLAPSREARKGKGQGKRKAVEEGEESRTGKRRRTDVPEEEEEEEEQSQDCEYVDYRGEYGQSTDETPSTTTAAVNTSKRPSSRRPSSLLPSADFLSSILNGDKFPRTFDDFLAFKYPVLARFLPPTSSSSSSSSSEPTPAPAPGPDPWTMEYWETMTYKQPPFVQSHKQYPAPASSYDPKLYPGAREAIEMQAVASRNQRSRGAAAAAAAGGGAAGSVGTIATPIATPVATPAGTPTTDTIALPDIGLFFGRTDTASPPDVRGAGAGAGGGWGRRMETMGTFRLGTPPVNEDEEVAAAKARARARAGARAGADTPPLQEEQEEDSASQVAAAVVQSQSQSQGPSASQSQSQTPRRGVPLRRERKGLGRTQTFSQL